MTLERELGELCTWRDAGSKHITFKELKLKIEQAIAITSGC